MIEAKTQLAKLLATEDITVRHSATADTASFDVKARILTLPIWTVEDKDVLDMMTGHEVGHALWTAMQAWEDAVLKAELHKGILNIVEDARIEKKIKRKYPGLTRQFVTGYKTLEQKNFFYKEGESVSDFNLLDRINLAMKMGSLRGIQFNKVEQYYVDRVESVETWDDVLVITEELMEYMQELQDDEAEEQQSSLSNEEGSGSSNSDDGGDFDDDFDGMEGEDPQVGDPLPENLVETQEHFDSKQHQLLSDKAKKHQERIYFTLPEPNLKSILIPYKTVIDRLGVEVEHMDKVAEGQYAVETEFYHRGRVRQGGRNKTDCEAEFRTFKRDSQKIIGYMVKEFERKKSASEYRKESISKTGVLDVNKLFSYKYNEDLFLRNTIRPDGKNHGMVMLLDWSASMSHNLYDTMKQVINMVWFCNKVNVPFEVYAFTNAYHHAWEDRESGDWKREDYIRGMRENGGPQWKYKGNNATLSDDDGVSHFHLMNLFSSRMSAKDLSKMLKLIWRHAWGHFARHERWIDFGLGSTPLIEGLCAINKIIPNFKEHYKLDICNLIVLTDGEGNTSFGRVNDREGYDSQIREGNRREFILEDEKTKMSYRLKDMADYRMVESKLQERAVLSLLKDRHNINIVGIFLDGSSTGKRILQRTLEDFIGWKYFNKEGHKAAREMCKKTGIAAIQTKGYDEYYIIPVGTIRDESTELDIDGSMTASKIKNAFKKNQNTKFGNKVLVNRMMDIIA